MAEAVMGSRIIYKYRPLISADLVNASMLAFVTENSRSKSKDAEVTATKNGPVRTPGQSEVEIECTSIIQKGDPTLDDFEDNMDANVLMEIWEINLDNPATGTNSTNKYAARYFQGYITSLEISTDAEGYAEASLTFGCNGDGVVGDATVTPEEIEAASYAFADTVASGSGGSGQSA